MKSLAVSCLMIIILSGSVQSTTDQVPILISPGTELGIAVVGELCPTFSWTAVDDAVAYRIEVYAAVNSQFPPFEVKSSTSYPVLVKEIPGKAISWTPSVHECLSSGGSYVWYVQSIDAYGEAHWSEGKSFRVEAALINGLPGESGRETLVESPKQKKSGNGVLSLSYPIGIQGYEGDYNTYYGKNAGINNTVSHAAFFGYMAGHYNTTGRFNTFIGDQSGLFNTTGEGNTFLGMAAGASNTSGHHNTMLGRGAGWMHTTGSSNTCVGNSAGHDNAEGDNNVMLGHAAGNSSTGSENTFIGSRSGIMCTGNGNVFLGFKAGYNETDSNKLFIDNSDTSEPLIYGEFDTDIVAVIGSFGLGTKSPEYPLELKKSGTNASIVVDRIDGATNYFNATATSGNIGTATNHVLRLVVGGLWTMRLHTDNSLTMRNGASCTSGGVWTNASSRELKENIRALSVDEAVSAMQDLNPVKYNYKVDSEDSHLGFIAEDVPELVASKDHKGLSPMDVVAVLTKVLQEQQKINAELRQEIADLKRRLCSEK